jgi:hypothetical protein
MKKVLILLLVLGLSSMASAIVDLGISVTLDPYGDPTYIDDPVSTEIWLMPSEIIWIDIHGIVSSGEYLSVYLIAQGPATMIGGQILQGSGAHVEYHPDDEVPDAGGMTWGQAFAEIAGYPGVGPMINFIELKEDDPFPDMVGVMFDRKEFHCLDNGDVIITLIGEDVWTGGQPLDQLIIHQIPEPMTIVLLGLGGLFLRRRR